MNPSVVVPEAASAPFHGALSDVTRDPLTLKVPPHSWEIACPPARSHVTVQPLSARDPAVTVISPWKPPGQELTVR